MYHGSNHLLFVLNLSLCIIAVPMMVISITVSDMEQTECVRVVQQPTLVIGILIFLVSVMGMLSCCFRFAAYLWIYLFFLLLLMIGLFCFTMFVFLVTDDKVGVALRDTGFMQHDHASDHPYWLRNQIKWLEVRKCMSEGRVCRSSKTSVPLTLSFFGHNLAVIKGGCCRPPPSCGFKFINETAWSGDGGVHSLEGDCKKWSNDSKVMCFECDTCKASMIHNLRDGWRRITAATFLILVLLNVIYAVGCCAYKNLKIDKYPSRIYHY